MVSEAASPAARRSNSSSVEREEHAHFSFEATMTLEWVRQQAVAVADERGWSSEHSVRNLLFALTKELGDLSEAFQWKGDSFPVKGECSRVVHTQWKTKDRTHLREELSDVLFYLVLLADKCRVDLPTVAHEKMIKNARKYPSKFAIEPLATALSNGSQDQHEQESTFHFEAESTLELFRLKTVHFADERGWAPNLRPRNLLLALTAEVGELCEIFQWKGDDIVIADWTPAKRVHLGEELSDVLLYLVQLADRSFADLAAGVRFKLAQRASSE